MQTVSNTKVIKEIIFLFIILIIPTGYAQPADMCRAVALRDVMPVGTDNPNDVLKRGEYITAITQYIVNKETGDTTLCGHGTSCYPIYIIIEGKKIEALQLTNCKVGKLYDPDSSDEEEIVYSVEMDRSKNSPHDLLLDDIDDKLIEMELGYANAANLAAYYVDKPNSQCGKLVKQALDGDSKAIDQLQSTPSYCK